MELAAIYIGLAVVVGIGARFRGRNAFAWFLLSLILSPLIAGFALLILPAPLPAKGFTETLVPVVDDNVFVPDGVFFGIPYQARNDGSIDALMDGKVVRFAEISMLIEAAEHRAGGR